ncbi:HDOD domain-containing protein [Herbaspirillum sp. RTI4]|uniref:EAL and HDOD domain-containing protein n=1 Tax=Herbaspirillum sp. RTI4 TaxID=3048640 RepID=UPI002AB45A1B|nr:HDOD domain-containing protein [Herbaspirillum sp. RTI4]MDY7579252.1 HDOD domain-containing protein [Herbaspirillum sp. RTI4]MEA9982751.1 HDOD domain-containing protein [Herbaspirillum sp. RTI4]
MAVKDSTDAFPLVFFQPVADIHYNWTALMLHVSPPAQGGSEFFTRLFNEFGLADALGHLSCILPVQDPDQFDADFGVHLGPKQVIARVPVAHCIDAEKSASFDRLHKQGLGLIVDGLPPHGAELNKHVSAMVLHCQSGTSSDAVSWLQKLRGAHIVEQVPDQLRLDVCSSAGFRWFSGDYALHPSNTASQRDAISHARLLKMLELVSRDADAHEIELLLRQDPALSYQLFKLVSSAAFGYSSHVTSFNQAINLLGRRQLQRWLQLLLYARNPNDIAANPLLPRAAARAGLMEAMCKELGYDRDEQDRAFIVGMFSLLNILLDMSLAEILQPLTMPPDVVEALLERSGRLGQLLDIVERSEYGGAPLRHEDLERSGLDAESYCHCLMRAYRWAAQVSHDA